MLNFPKDNKKFEVVVITTGGTIEKTYDEFNGLLDNRESVFKQYVLDRLRLPHTYIHVVSLFAKDSLRMTDKDRQILLLTIQNYLERELPIIILHGTDSMTISAKECLKEIKKVNVPVIFTGAMKPFGFYDSDAGQNVTEALLASRLLPPGFYISFHNRIFEVPHVKKNLEKGSFEFCQENEA